MCAAKTKQYSLVFFLWILFSICCFIAPFVGMFFWAYPKHSYMRRFVKAADRMIAALLGFSGRHTLSVEVAYARDYQWLHDTLNAVEAGHCENEAFEEGAYCRISDHQRGDK